MSRTVPVSPIQLLPINSGVMTTPSSNARRSKLAPVCSYLTGVTNCCGVNFLVLESSDFPPPPPFPGGYGGEADDSSQPVMIGLVVGAVFGLLCASTMAYVMWRPRPLEWVTVVDEGATGDATHGLRDSHRASDFPEEQGEGVGNISCTRCMAI